MSNWQSFPPDYRSSEIQKIVSAVRAGECASIIGLSGAGKSNLTGFMVHRQELFNFGTKLVLVDCNRMAGRSQADFTRLVLNCLPGAGNTVVAETPAEALAKLEDKLELLCGELPGMCLVFDRFELLQKIPEAGAIYNNLRALRDVHKYWLTFIFAGRRTIDPQSELSELVTAHTQWLGALSEKDGHWSIAGYARRAHQEWNDATISAIYELSSGYPSMLRAVCEAHTSGAALDLDTLIQHPAIVRRIQEFWADEPTDDDLHSAGISKNPLLVRAHFQPGQGSILNDRDLTAKEHLLWEYLRLHPGQVCEKDDLIRAVWPEDKIFSQGIRDDSLAQLVRRLRVKIEADASNPVYIHTMPGRGYRYTPPELKEQAFE